MANQAPQQQQPAPAQKQDPLANLLAEVQVEKKRIQGIKEPTVSSLKAEVGGTNLDLLEDALKQMLGIRNHLLAVQSWAAGEFQKFAENEGFQDERLDLLETFGGDTQILPDHAQALLDVIEGCAFVAQKLLQGPFPIEAPDEDATAALTQLQEKCAAAKALVEGAVMTPEEDEEGEEEEEEDPSEIRMPQGVN